MVKLAANAPPGERRYVLLAGAGLSIDAGLPTAWGLMLATAAMLRAREDADDGRSIEEWFLASEFAQQRYDQLIGALFPTSAAQRGFMRDRLRAEEPGRSHRLVAELARLGVIRCVITTNFDTLIEQATREVGLTVQVIADDEQLRTSGPLIQCREFRVYKPHGTIEGGRLRNTPADLRKLSGPMERELARVISDHGLIVLGYSGSDPGIRRVFQKKRQYLFPTFWANPSPPDPDLPALFGVGTFDHVQCVGAASFLDDLLGMYRKLDAMVPRTGLEAAAVTADEAIRRGMPDAPSRVRRFWEGLVEELRSLSPKAAGLTTGDEFDVALEATLPLSTQFARVAAAVAETGAREAAIGLHRGFEGAIAGYFLPRGVGGYEECLEFDFYRFMGHELFVTMIGLMMREDRWETIAELLDRELLVDNHPDGQTRAVGYDYISQEVAELLSRDRLHQKIRHYHHAELLKNRHADGELTRVTSMEEFTAADYLLGLRTEIHRTPGQFLSPWWGSWSCWFLNRVPRFLYEARRREFATRLATVLKVPDISGLRKAVKEHGRHDERTFETAVRIHPTQRFDVEAIGSI